MILFQPNLCDPDAPLAPLAMDTQEGLTTELDQDYHCPCGEIVPAGGTLILDEETGEVAHCADCQEENI
jgi:hypothetical protein